MRVVRCPICRSEVSWEDNPHRPFCSERCRLLDLGGWIEDRYRIPGKNVEPEDIPDDDDDDESR
ncbi:MAG: DNA gyrase inhibitor YacG [Deltaproteobacteria bacterium RIFCSPLOWO2_12_FULL_60_19]|nr:MAG: DNA gyrase inhibitor YacG [Deltaproteobacteria bacterium RIFCSPLOWO2_12_FULL_60_19]